MPDDWDWPTAVRPSPQLAPRTSALLGQRLGHYLVKSLVGSGGMGEVYEGEQPEIGKRVAIKVLKASGAVEREQVERMLAEARAVNAIRHPNIVDVFDFGRLPDGRPYLVMDWLEGEPLDAVLRRSGSLPPLEVVELLEQLCAPLAAAHAKGIIHRDLKPANVFVSGPAPGVARQVKLLDFGLARSLEPGRERLTRAGMVVGTPDYLAPEQAAGLDVGPAADLYSLGVIAFELLTGQLPFIAADAREVMVQKVRQGAPRVSSRNASVPAELDQLVFELMAHAPADRPAAADQVQQRLARLKSQLRPPGTRSVSLPALSVPAPATPVGAPVAAPAPRESRWLTVVLSASAGVVAVGLASVLLAGREGPVIEPPPATPIAHPVETAPAPAPPPAVTPAPAVINPPARKPPPAVAPVPAVINAPARKPPASGAKPPVGKTPVPSLLPKDAPLSAADSQAALYAELNAFRTHARERYPEQATAIDLEVNRLMEMAMVSTRKNDLAAVARRLEALRERYPLFEE